MDRMARLHVFIGQITAEDQLDLDGTQITAWVDGHNVGSAIVTGGKYQILVRQMEERSFDGMTIYFKIGEIIADQTSIWSRGGADVLDLSGRSECKQLP